MFAVNPRKYAPKPPPLPAWPKPPELHGRVVLTRKVEDMPMPFEPRGPYLVPLPVDSAWMAKQRLLAVVAADREACPAWRWVCLKPEMKRTRNMDPRTWAALRGWARARYRWERRA